MPKSLLFRTSSPIRTAECVRELNTNPAGGVSAKSTMDIDGFFVMVDVATRLQASETRYTVASIDYGSVEIFGVRSAKDHKLD